MERETAEKLFLEGGVFVLLDMPPGTEFGIDMNIWNVGEKFKGIKMIPPGLHFIYYSAVNKEGQTAPRTGFFHYFKQRELLVKHYDCIAEDLKTEENLEDNERIQANLKSLDRELGPYPLNSWEKWVSLTQHVSCDELNRLQPLSGRICSVPELVRVEEIKRNDAGQCERIACFTKDGLPDMIPKSGTEIRFTEIPKNCFPEGATGSIITKCSMDLSYSLNLMTQKLATPEALLSELQFAFICFLVGQVWDGWEHWRNLLNVLCRSEDFLISHHEMYRKLLIVLYFQIQEVCLF